MRKLVIYHEWIPRVGGIESAVKNLASALTTAGLDVTIAFHGHESADSLFGYAKVCNRVLRVLPDITIQADTCLIASNHALPPQIQVKRRLQWIHSDYKKYGLKLKDNGRVTYVAVSEHTAQVARDLFGVQPIVIRNLVAEDFVRPEGETPLRLVTNSRISPEKGFGRMREFALGLRKAAIPFRWVVMGDNSHDPEFERTVRASFQDMGEVSFVGFKEDVRFGLLDSDYLVQLSDFEGCPYAVLEALRLGVPIITTNWPGADELVEEGVNGYLVPLSMKRIDYKRFKKIPKDFTFSQDGLIERWLKLV